jgi:sensor c-di-GMP phosphodiesterase-like protein
MNSVLDALRAAEPEPGAERGAPWRPSRVLERFAWWKVRTEIRGSRRLRIDGRRLLVAAVVTAILASAGAWAWVWNTYRRSADASAAVALAFVDRRLDAVEAELAQLSRAAAALPTPLTTCPDGLVAKLLQQSLQSNLVRRFDLVQIRHPLQCGPEGERRAESLEAGPPAGLSIVAGGHVAAPVVVLRPLAGTAVLQATLDRHALALPRSELPVELQSTHLRIDVQSSPAGSLAIWDARPNPGRTLPALVLTADSKRHSVGVRVQVDDGDLMADIRWHALAAAAAALMILAWVVDRIWQRVLQRSRLTYRLQRALKKRQFVPFVQPIVDLHSGRCIGGEVLMRWNHPQRGILAPAEFIDEAERSGLIMGMSDLTMALAAQQLAPLAQAEPQLYFSFNITPGQLREPGFAVRLSQIFGGDTLPRHRVMLELTEREFVDPVAKRGLAALRSGGWQIAIDDFGTGQSSLASIENLGIDRIKVDRSFVSTVDEKTVSRPVLDAIIGLAHELGVPMIAEGVETHAQWSYLAARGVACAQGYLMAKPMAVGDFVRWFTRHQAGVADPTASTQPSELAGVASPSPLTGAQRDLWRRMASAGGLDVRDRIYRMRVFRNCFVGSQAVDWIARECGVGRAEALRLGRNLLALGLVRHVEDEHDFKDAELFYRLVPSDDDEAMVNAPAATDLRQALIGDLEYPWKDHCRGLLRHSHCTTGRTLVSWIVRRYSAPRSTATQWATQLMRQGTLHHVFDDRPFRDDHSLYRLG